MKRPERTHTQPKNTTAAVPEIQGKAKHGKAHVNPIVAGTKSPAQKVYHTKPFSQEKPVSDVYAVIDNDLARDNIENDLTAADIQDWINVNKVDKKIRKKVHTKLISA